MSEKDFKIFEEFTETLTYFQRRGLHQLQERGILNSDMAIIQLLPIIRKINPGF